MPILEPLFVFLALTAFAEFALRSEDRRKSLLELLNATQPPFAKAYYSLLARALRALTGLIGEPFQARNFTISFWFAVTYTAAAFLGRWLLYGHTNLGNLNLVGQPRSWALAAGVVSAVAILAVVLPFVPRLVKWLEQAWPVATERGAVRRNRAVAMVVGGALAWALRWLFLGGARLPGWAVLLAILWIGAIALVIATRVFSNADASPGGAAGGTGGAAGGIGGALLTGALLGGGEFELGLILLLATLAFSGASVLGPSLVLFESWLLLAVLAGFSDASLKTPLLVAIIPMINASADWLSWSTSQVLGRCLCRRPGKLVTAAVLAADVLVAGLTLVALVAGMTIAIETVNVLSVAQDGRQVLAMAEIRQSAVDEGWWIALFLGTTLLPTLAHFILGILGVMLGVVVPEWWRSKVRGQLEASAEGNRGSAFGASVSCGVLGTAILYGTVLSGYAALQLANLAYGPVGEALAWVSTQVSQLLRG